MPVNPKKVQGRRTLHFTSLDAVVADAQMLASSLHVKTLGNWPLPQLLAHLAAAINSSIDGSPVKAPWFIKVAARLMKNRVLRKGISPGFRVSKTTEARIFPAAASLDNAFNSLRTAVARTQVEPMNARHPIFGQMTRAEWTQLHLRHAELHLSFVVPE